MTAKNKNIWFRCPSCDGKLVVASTAGGCRAHCPECQTLIPIPSRSTMMPGWLRQAIVYAVQVCLVIVTAGAGTWWVVRADRDVAAPAEKPDAVTGPAPVAASTRDQAIEDQALADREINRKLEQDHQDLQGRYAKMMEWMVENYRGKYPLPERLVQHLRIKPVTDTGEISGDLAELLKLSDEEKMQVQGFIQYARATAKQAERDLVRVLEQSELRISYEVPVFPEAGLPMREDLYARLESALGAPRFDRMIDVAGESLREELHYFGEASRNLSFEIILPMEGSGHPPYLLIRDGWMVPEGDSVRLTKVKETAVLELPPSYRDYQDWLPDNFAAYTLQ